MLAHNGVEAFHCMCIPNHGRGRIRAAALHVGIIDKIPTDGVLEDDALVARKKKY